MITLLRQKLNDYMVLWGLSPNTQEAYTNAVAGLAGYYHLSPDKLNPDGHPKCPTYGHFKMPHLR